MNEKTTLITNTTSAFPPKDKNMYDIGRISNDVIVITIWKFFILPVAITETVSGLDITLNIASNSIIRINIAV